MAFTQTLKEFFLALAHHKGVDEKKCFYKSTPIVGEDGNVSWELDVLLVTELYGFAIGKFTDRHAVLKNEDKFYALESTLLTDEQNQLIHQHFDELRLSQMTPEEERCLQVNAIETLCFAGHEFLTTPVDLTPYLIALGRDVFVLDTQRLAYKSLITPNRSMFTQNLTLGKEHEIRQVANLENDNELQSPSL